jgi:hypothetical protein
LKNCKTIEAFFLPKKLMGKNISLALQEKLALKPEIAQES